MARITVKKEKYGGVTKYHVMRGKVDMGSYYTKAEADIRARLLRNKQ